MKKLVALCMFVLAGSAYLPPAQADTWQTKFLVNKATSKIRNVDKAVVDTNGNKWFHAYEASDSNGDGFSESFLYEYSASGQWTDYTDTLKGLVDGNVNWQDASQWGINSLYADKSGNVWVGAAPCSLLKFDGSSWSVVSSQTMWQQALGESVTGINGGYVYSIFGDNSGNVYAVASVSADSLLAEDSIRLLKYTASAGTWSVAIGKDAVMSYANQSKLTGAYNDTTGDFWFYMYYGETTPTGVYRYHSGSWTNYRTEDGIANNKINNLKIDSSGNVWLATDSGASKWNGTSWATWTTDNSSLASNYVERIAEDNSGRIWFTSVHDTEHNTQGGAAIYNPATAGWSYYSAKNGDDDFEDVIKLFFLGDDMWAVANFQEAGFTILAQNDTYATLYGQVGGTIVEKAGLGGKLQALKKNTVKKVTVYSLKNGKKKVVYRGRTASGWYKALNLRVGKSYKIKIQGKPLRKVKLNSGDPLRSNF